jgi:hypothetical protein
MNNQTLDQLKVEIFPGINDVPVIANANKAGNGSDLINRLNQIIEKLKEINSLTTQVNTLSASLDGLTTTVNGIAIPTTEQMQDVIATLFTTGQHTGITATYDDTNNRINLVVAASGGATTYPTVEVNGNSVVLITPGQNQKLNFNSPTTAPHFNASNPTRLTAVNAGTYLITGTIFISASAPSYEAFGEIVNEAYFNVQVLRNGATNEFLQERIIQKGATDLIQFSIVRSLPANSYLEFSIYSDMEVGNLETGSQGRTFSMTRLS